MNVKIVLKNSDSIEITDFTSVVITGENGVSNTIKPENVNEFYLFDNLSCTFLSENESIALGAKDISYVIFD